MDIFAGPEASTSKTPGLGAAQIVRRLRNGFGAALIGALIANLIVRHLAPNVPQEYWTELRVAYWCVLGISFAAGFLLLYQKGK
ncbi:hypothetical protein BSFA1_83600 (plasmid) [Burkholderia sp. SFA1]|nr:hypothetical protein BSFA1_83600 [Burkholderia sp. SFA1]